MKKFQIKVNEEQLREIIHALEVVARLNIGQLDMALDCCLDENGNSHIVPYDTCKQIESMVKPLMGLSHSSSYGVGKFEKTDMIWDMYEVFRHHHSWQRAIDNGIVDSMNSKRDWNSMMSVNYDEPMQWNKKVSLAKIQTIEE